jgi:hypothetical protein
VPCDLGAYRCFTNVYPWDVSALAWWLIPIGATVLATLFVIFRNRPSRPIRTSEGLSSMRAMRRAMEKPLPMTDPERP